MENAEPLQERPQKWNPCDPWDDRAIRSGTTLDPRGNLPLREGRHRCQRKNHKDHREPLEEALHDERKVEVKIDHLRKSPRSMRRKRWRHPPRSETWRSPP